MYWEEGKGCGSLNGKRTKKEAERNRVERIVMKGKKGMERKLAYEGNGKERVNEIVKKN